MDLTIVALQKHLRYSCCPAEVAVDLEGRVGVEQIRVCASPAVACFSRRIDIVQMGLQHLVGMIHSKKIIAINTDQGCNMFKVADYGIVEDYEKVIPALVERLEELS